MKACFLHSRASAPSLMRLYGDDFIVDESS